MVWLGILLLGSSTFLLGALVSWYVIFYLAFGPEQKPVAKVPPTQPRVPKGH